MTKEQRFDRIASIVSAAVLQVGEDTRTREVFDDMSPEDIWEIRALATKPLDYEFQERPPGL